MAKIVVVGLGAGDEESLSLGVLRLLKGENPVFCGPGKSRLPGG